MTETSSPPKPPAELHWGIVYLREDIQDLRTEMRGLYTRIDDLRNEMIAQLGNQRSELTIKIDNQCSEFSAQFGSQRTELTAQIDSLRGELTTQFSNLRGEMVSRFYWTIATMVTLAGVMAAVVKL